MCGPNGPGNGNPFPGPDPGEQSREKPQQCINRM
jgi:hypothetical protein